MHHFPIPVAVALATLSGAGIGLSSGLLIAYFDLAAFVITLGVMAIGRSLAYIFSGQTSISDIPPELNDLVYTTVFGVQTNVLTLLVLYAVAWSYLTFTKGGRTIYAVGSNREAARTAGLDVLFYSVVPYVVSGALSAIVIGFVAPESFTLFLSISFLVGSAIGGIATIGGAIVGGIFIQFVPNLANDISDAAPSALYGVAMLLFMYAMPHGVVGTLGPLLARSMLRIQARWPALIGK